VAQQGKRSTSVALVGQGAVGATEASFSVAARDVSSIAGPRVGVNRVSARVSNVLSNRDLMGRPATGSAARHTGPMSSAGSVAADLRSSVTARAGQADRHSIVGISATSPEDSIDPQYRIHRSARYDGVRVPRKVVLFFPGCTAEIEVDMPVAWAVGETKPWAVIEASRRVDVAVRRPMTGVDAA
jgi:hypothetical protein